MGPASPLALLLFQVVAIVAVARALGALARRLGQPAVIAEVLAGILLGPSLLGWAWPAGFAALFPEHAQQGLSLVSHLGLVLFMFLVGLELDHGQLRGRVGASLLIAQAGIAFPFALGAGLAWFLFEGHAPPGVPMTAFVLFLGVAMSITAFPVMARILSERKLSQTRVGTTALAAAAVNDVAAWCVLPFVVAAARATQADAAVRTLGLAALFGVVMLALVRPFLKGLAQRVTDGRVPTAGATALVLMLLLASAGVADLVGIHALFGAFLLGAIVPRETVLGAPLAWKLETVVTTLLLPVFFAFSGLRTELGLVSGGAGWAMTALIIALATVGKLGGASIAARATGLPWREAGAVGALMNARGLMELVVLNIGLELGVLTPALFTMLVLMALVTTVATGPLLSAFAPPRLLGDAPDETTRPNLIPLGPPASTEIAEARLQAQLRKHWPTNRPPPQA